jgi:hypothetical protein
MTDWPWKTNLTNTVPSAGTIAAAPNPVEYHRNPGPTEIKAPRLSSRTLKPLHVELRWRTRNASAGLLPPVRKDVTADWGRRLWRIPMAAAGSTFLDRMIRRYRR